MKPTIIRGLIAACLLLPFAVNATPIKGTISLGGTLHFTCDAEGIECELEDATGVAFENDGQGLVNGTPTGDFAANGVAFGDIVTMQDFDFNPLTTNNPLWAVGGFAFDIETLDTFIVDPSNGLFLAGTGIISFSPEDEVRLNDTLEDTFGRWSFSADSTTATGTFGWSSTAAIPEPAILMLLGLGLAGGLGARRLAGI